MRFSVWTKSVWTTITLYCHSLTATKTVLKTSAFNKRTPSDLIELLVNSDELSGFVNSSVKAISYKLNNKMFFSSDYA